MRGAGAVYRAISLFLMLGMALSLGVPMPQALGAERVAPPEGMAEVNPAMPMPTFSLPGPNGESFNSSALRGQVVVVRFWATW
jgi:cytochrome oxidase Cu insertion factor (SCO1/SenC/PrrC family)